MSSIDDDDFNEGPAPDWFVAVPTPAVKEHKSYAKEGPAPKKPSRGLGQSSRSGLGKTSPKKSYGRQSNSASGERKPAERRRGPRQAYTPVMDENGDEVPLTDKQKDRIRTKAMNSAMWHLDQSMKTRKEIADKLALKAVPTDIIEETLDKLEEVGFLNDANYAEVFVRSRTEGRGLGKRRISMELRRKGVDEDLVAEALDEVDDETEKNIARDLVDKRLRSTQGLERSKRVNRLVGFLARRGYNGSMAYQVVKEALDEEGDLEEETWDTD